MCKKIKILAFTCALSASSFSYSAGIPVVSVSELTQQIAVNLVRIEEFRQDIQNATSMLNEARATADHYKNMVEGHYNFEDILNDNGINAFIDLSAYQDIYDSVDDLNSYREEYELIDDNPAVQRRYDALIKRYVLQQKILEENQKRTENLQDLLVLLPTATTPAAKQDIQNSIALEQAKLANNSQMFANIQATREQEERMKITQEARESTNSILSGTYQSTY